MANGISIHTRGFQLVLHAGFCLAMACAVLPATADDLSWNTGDGWFFDANNWNPAGAPQSGDIIRIGNLPVAAGSTVLMGGQPGFYYGELHLSSGVTLDMNGSELVSFGNAWINGIGTRLIVRPSAGPNFHDFNGTLLLGQNSFFELKDNVDVRLFQNSVSSGTILGRGTITAGDFQNNGIIRPDNNGGLIFNVGQPVPNLSIDLDGSTGNGQLQLDQLFSVLEINAGSLTDSFGGTVSMAPGALLAMNINSGWVADSNSSINVAGFNNPAAASQISGTSVSLGGQLNVGGAQGHLRLLAPATIQNTAEVNIGATDWLELDGATAVQGGQFTVGQGGKLDFDGPTTMQGGVFGTHSNSIVDGFVAFNGPTTWNGNVVLNGVSRQNGDAFVNSALGAVINANLFDMDGGSGNTNWNINGNLVINADRIGLSSSSRFNGTINIAGGFFPKLTMNLTDPGASWVMGGTMNLSGLTNLPESRVAGSRMVVEGNLNVSGGRVRIDADTTFSGVGGGANIQIGPADAVLQMQGNTIVDSNVSFLGAGTLQNAASGILLLRDGVSSGPVGLVNHGLLEIGNRAGIASVNRFENTGSWNVDLGGLLAGLEHDLLIVGGGEAFLDGLLEVDLIDVGNGLFAPGIGDEFTILASLGGVNGTFLNDPVSLLNGKQYHWSVLYNSHDVRLQLAGISVPEPGSIFVLAVFSTLLLVRGRRRPVVRTPDEFCGVRHRDGLWAGGSRHRKQHLIAGGVTAAIWAAISLAPQTVAGQIKHWNTGGVGSWSDPGNWTPNGIPFITDFVQLGSLPQADSADVHLDSDQWIGGLTISNGVLLHTNGHSLQTLFDTEVIGQSPNTSETSRLAIDGNPASTGFTTRDLTVSDGGFVILIDNGTLNVNRTLNVGSGSSVFGAGVIHLNGNAPLAMVNDGTIFGRQTGLTINQNGNGIVDLDGHGGNGVVTVGERLASAPTPGESLTFNLDHLADSFSGTINVSPGTFLNMNIASGWTADSGSRINMIDYGWGYQSAKLEGSHLTLAGALVAFTADNNIGTMPSRFTGRFNCSVTIQNTATVDIGDHNGIEFAGDTTINGGSYTLGQGALLNFAGTTTINGGQFSTQSLSMYDGVVNFNGPTVWHGSVDIDGVARQNGNATVTGTTTINAGVLDMDGFFISNTWNILGTAVINAHHINSLSNSFHNELNIGGGFLHKLTMNLDSPWLMAGQLNLTGNNSFFVSRIGGSEMWVNDTLTLASGRAQIDADLTFTNYGKVHLTGATAQLRLMGNSRIQSGVQMSGAGELWNGVDGSLTLEDGVTFSDVGLVNQGEMRIGDPSGDSPTGVATVNRFENDASGIWNVEIGGWMAGSEHDLLLVNGGQTLLDGILNVDLIDAGNGMFLPEIGDEFTILYSLANISGSFLADPVSQIGGDLYHWSVLYHPHDVTLQLTSISAGVPEPSATLVIFPVGALGISRRRKRSPA